MGNHLALLVRCDDSDTTWLVDVGFGGALLAPVPLAVGEYVHAPFRLGLRRTPDDYWQFYEDAGDGEFSFDFQALPADEAVLATRCQFQNSDPSSVFVQNFVAQRRLPETHRTLRGRVLSEAGPGGMSTRHIDTADEFVATLRDDFSLDVPESAALWPRIVERHEAFLREKAG